jgi:hypothetical protein
MPCAVNKTAAAPATASSRRHHPDAPPDIIPEEPEWAWSVAEQLVSDSEPRGHETQTELTSASRVAFLGQLSASIAEINQPISAVVMNAEAALLLLVSQPTDTEAIRRLLACIVKDGMRTGDIANRSRTLIDGFLRNIGLVVLDLEGSDHRQARGDREIDLQQTQTRWIEAAAHLGIRPHQLERMIGGDEAARVGRCP